MSKIIKLKKGLDIRLRGEATKNITRLPVSGNYAVSPSDFIGVVPKLLVREGDAVKAGTPLFFDKNRPEILFPSPVSGKVTAVVRGEKRKLLDIVVAADPEQEAECFDVSSFPSMGRLEVIEVLLKSGMWPFIIQRPYGIVASPGDVPRSVFVSGFDSAPLAPDLEFALADRAADLQKGFDVLGKLTEGKVCLGLRAGTSGVLSGINGVEINHFDGPHPAGNVGVQINNTYPINKGDVVWTVDIQSVAVIGKLFREGTVDYRRTYAVAGSEVADPAYFSAVAGTPVESFLKGNIRPQQEGESLRIISGNVLTGRTTAPDGYVSWYTNLLTVIPEGDKYAFLGWAMPRFDKFSVSRTFFSWLTPKKDYDLDTNLNGGHRPFVLTGLFERYVPMDIYPVYLLKAILAGDIDKMENLGIYEVIEEDLALCEFVDPSKNDVQQIVRAGIDLMIKELN